MKDILRGYLHRLVVEERIPTKNIAILTTARKQALQNQLLGQFRVKAEPDTSRNEILCNTIYYFKGLESPVVILVETELCGVANLNNLLYVGTEASSPPLDYSPARRSVLKVNPDPTLILQVLRVI